MSDEVELDAIADEITYLKELEVLTPPDVNKLMVIMGNLVGLLRTYSDDESTSAFIERVDNLVLSGHFALVTVFYVIPVAIEILSKIYSANSVRRPRKRYHRKKKKREISAVDMEAKIEVNTPEDSKRETEKQ